MPGSPITIAIEDIKRSIQENDHGKILGCVLRYQDYKTNISDVIKTLSEGEQVEYLAQMQELDTNIDDGIRILNQYIEATLNDFSNLSMKDKQLFIKVVESLINISCLNILPSDMEELCKIFLTYLSTASAQDEDVFKRIYKVLTIEKKDDLLKDEDGNPLRKMWVSEVLGDREFLIELLRNTYGRNYQSLKEIFMEINDIQVPTEIDNKLSCSIIKGDCNKFITIKDIYFVAFPFSEIEIEGKIISSLKEKFDGLEPLIARNVLDNSTVLCQVCQFILSSKFGVFVLDKHTLDKLNRFLPNPNVTLELGLAIGHGKKFIMLVEKGTTILSDMQGYIRIEYNSIDEIPEKIQNQNFSNF